MEGNVPSGSVQPNPSPLTPHPSPPAQEVGWYLYGILPCSASFPPGIGIDGHSPLVMILEGALGALASLVPLDEFGAEPLRRHLEDPHWMEEKVRHHERIVEMAMAEGPILPMRFGTIFLRLERVRKLLSEHAATIRHALDYLGDKEEWGVKGFADRDRLQETLLSRDPGLRRRLQDLNAKPPGQAFLLKKRFDEEVRAQVLTQEGALAEAVEELLRDRVVELVRKPLLSRQATGRRQEMIVNLACLVPKEDVKLFRQQVARWNATYGEAGLELLTSGPWPPYHFSPELEDDGSDAAV